MKKKEKKELTSKQQKIIAGCAIAVFVIFLLAVFLLVGVPMSKFVSEPERFRQWVESKGFLGQLIYMGMVILQVIVAIIPGEPLEIAGGYAFGAIEGAILCIIAATVGSLIVFGFVRRFGIKLVEVFFPREKLRSLRFLRNSPKRDFLFLLIFTIPGTPKDMLCYFAGLTDMKLGVWMLISSLGRLPAIITSTVGGNALGTQNYLFAALTFAVALLISGAGMLIYNAVCKKHEQKKAAKAGASGSDAAEDSLASDGAEEI
ncbi:MAG: TVP38/TMEM64 family protein [Clostridia bacterium]|nr:TVP38/TMEM64 family protein [Clostridia bacterium]